jgi:hypothetical protein
MQYSGDFGMLDGIGFEGTLPWKSTSSWVLSRIVR